MTRKRHLKLLMSAGVQRNAAIKIISLASPERSHSQMFGETIHFAGDVWGMLTAAYKELGIAFNALCCALANLGESARDAEEMYHE